MSAYKGRFLCCINDYKISDGLRYPPEELAEWQNLGVTGYKIWVGVSPLVDDPANDPTFTKMEQIGLTGASIHISQPYPTKWCEDPVKFWQAHNAWERVLELVSTDSNVELIIIQQAMDDLILQMGKENLEAINDLFIRFTETRSTPLLVVSRAGLAVEGQAEIEEKLGRAKIPIFPTLERAARAVVHVNQYFRVHKGKLA